MGRKRHLRLEVRLPSGRWARAGTVVMLAVGGLVALGLPLLVGLFAWSVFSGP